MPIRFRFRLAHVCKLNLNCALPLFTATLKGHVTLPRSVFSSYSVQTMKRLRKWTRKGLPRPRGGGTETLHGEVEAQQGSAMVPPSLHTAMAETTASGTESPNTQIPPTIEQEPTSSNILVSSRPEEPDVEPVAPATTVDNRFNLSEVPTDAGESPPTNKPQESIQGEQLSGQTNSRRSYEISEAFSGAASSKPELQRAVEEFQKNYRLFAGSHKKYILIEGDLEAGFPIQQTDAEIRDTAKAFGNAIWTTIGAIEKKDGIVGQKWPNKVGRFLVKLCPLARLALQLTGTVADVPYNTLNLIIVGDQTGAFERCCERSWYYPPGNPPFYSKLIVGSFLKTRQAIMRDFMATFDGSSTKPLSLPTTPIMIRNLKSRWSFWKPSPRIL
jgi:hypothetical protein